MPPKTWTDDQLRVVVAESRTWASVLRSLGLSPRGRNHYTITARVRHLGIDTSHFSMSSRPAEDDQLRRAVAESSSIEGVLDSLGLDQDRDTRERLKRRIRALGIDTGHFARTQVTPSRKRTRRWDDEKLRAAVAAAQSMAGTLRNLGLIAAGGNYDAVQRRIKELAIDTTHFTGQGWNVGLKYQPAPAQPIEQLLVRDRWTTSHHLKTRLIRKGLKQAKCELCGWCERAPDGRIPVELDHINGDRVDNRLENLRILCPNCHSLQPTHRGLNQKRRRRS
ncbi:MAG TPA: HNH endonuclease signature motif containing protein [Kofleriaceae bacterium]|nr:HNH endonuclease signature motif containing protein [Kofleriaceae bacterium]